MPTVLLLLNWLTQKYLAAFNKAYAANVKALKKIFTTKSFDDEYQDLLLVMHVNYSINYLTLK